MSKSPKGSAQSSVRVRIGGEKLIEHFESSKSQLDAHLALRAAMYGVLFQAYADAVWLRARRNLSSSNRDLFAMQVLDECLNNNETVLATDTMNNPEM